MNIRLPRKLETSQVDILTEAKTAVKGLIRCSLYGVGKKYSTGNRTGKIRKIWDAGLLCDLGLLKEFKSGRWGIDYKITPKGRKQEGNTVKG
jgi:hypothetical protein